MNISFEQNLSTRLWTLVQEKAANKKQTREMIRVVKQELLTRVVNKSCGQKSGTKVADKSFQQSYQQVLGKIY